MAQVKLLQLLFKEKRSADCRAIQSNFKTFARSKFAVRRRFTDFVFLYKTLSQQWGGCAVPPLPEKHNLQYVRGDRFGPDFTNRRAHSLHRFLKRLTLHPILRRQTIFLEFLESPDWNATMKNRPRALTQDSSSSSGGGVFDNITDTFLNAFTKVHKPDKRFLEVKEKADKLDEDLNTVEKSTTKVARRQADLETDYADLATQFQKLENLEAGLSGPLTSFASSLQTSSRGFQNLKEHTDQNYVGSLRDMNAYTGAIKQLLKTREQKQMDYEALTDYLSRSALDRDNLASHHGSSGLGASGFLRSKIEDVRGVDHEQSRRDRLRKLEIQIDKLTREVETSKRSSETMDEMTVKEVADFERIKTIEFQDTLGDLATAHIDFFKDMITTWEQFIKDMEKETAPGADNVESHIGAGSSD
jgi:sorting nexin-4